MPTLAPESSIPTASAYPPGQYPPGQAEPDGPPPQTQPPSDQGTDGPVPSYASTPVELAPPPSAAPQTQNPDQQPDAQQPQGAPSTYLPSSDRPPEPPPATSSPEPPVPPPSAGALLTAPQLKSMYEKIRDAVNAVPQPPYLAFKLVNGSQQSGEHHVERLKVVVRESDDALIVRTLRDTAGAAGDDEPQVFTTPTIPMTLIYRLADFPLADFGMRIVATHPGVFDAAGTPQPAPDAGDMRTLASVRVIDIPYVLTDLGPDTIGGRTVYHIGLEAKRDPGHHVLRQMWIDPDTFLPLRYVADRFVDDVVPFHYLVTVDTAIVAGHLVNTDADGHFYVRDTQGGDITGYSHWHITDVGFPEGEPAWAFDPDQLPQHREEMIPGL